MVNFKVRIRENIMSANWNVRQSAKISCPRKFPVQYCVWWKPVGSVFFFFSPPPPPSLFFLLFSLSTFHYSFVKTVEDFNSLFSSKRGITQVKMKNICLHVPCHLLKVSRTIPKRKKNTFCRRLSSYKGLKQPLSTMK